jgi:hypothetical protein
VACGTPPRDSHKEAAAALAYDRWVAPARACGQDFGRLGFVHHFRLERPEDVDGSLAALMREAYLVGRQDSPRLEPKSEQRMNGFENAR